MKKQRTRVRRHKRNIGNKTVWVKQHNRNLPKKSLGKQVAQQMKNLKPDQLEVGVPGVVKATYKLKKRK